MTDLVGDFRTSTIHHSLILSDRSCITDMIQPVTSQRQFPVCDRKEVCPMAFAYIDAKHPEVLVPPTASEHMQFVMQRHPNQSRLDWRKWIVKHPQK